jgi:inosine-uridine nucleoside N-ribohydrolase
VAHLSRSAVLAPLLAALLPVAAAAAEAPEATRPPRGRIPVILDTDIGDDIDDTWALVLLLKSPELDVRLIVTDFGNTVYRAKLVARVLEVAGRTDIPIGIGIRENDSEGGQAEWVRGYDLAKYRGQVREDGVAALVDTVIGSSEPMTLIAIGPCPNLKAALDREPRIASKLRLAGMYGSLRRGYGGKASPDAEWNVRANPAAARVLLEAPWADTVFTPLDTCGVVQLKGERYARVRDSNDPLLRALVENYRLWCPRQDWCAKDPEHVAAKSSTLFDTVAVYLALSRDLVRTEEIAVRVTDEGLTVPEASGRPVRWATEWTSLDGFEAWLVDRLTGTSAVATSR